MQKKNLFASAILMLCTLFMLTGCEEMMSKFDNPVSAYFELKEYSTTLYLGQTYQIEYTTISDATDQVTFEVTENENVASVDANGVVTGLSKGTAKIKVSIPATDYYQGATKEFTVTVDALLGLKEGKTTSVMLSKGDVYDLGVIAPEGSTPTYEPSNDNVTVDGNGVVTAQKYGDAAVKVSVTAFGRSESLTFDIKVRVQTETELNEIINAATGDVQVMLKDGFELEGGLDFTGKKVSLDFMNSGMKFKGSNAFTISDNFTLKNVIIDASGVSEKAVFLMSSTPTQSTNSKSCYEVEEVNFEGVTVTGIQQRFFYDNKKAYVVKKFKVDSCVIELATVETSSAIDGVIEFNQGGVIEFDIEKSTVYQTSNLNPKYFTKYNNSKVPDNAIPDYTACKFWTYKNNTFYKVATDQWHNGGRIAQKASTMTVDIENNIWVDCAPSGGSILRRLFGGNKKSSDFAAATIAHNTYWLNGDKEDNSSYDKTESPTPLTTDPNFKDAANGDFTPQGADQVANKTGDPRWFETN